MSGHGRQKHYTVVGLLGTGDLLVAGVLLGEHDPVDLPYESDGFRRFAVHVHADNADRAEEEARKIARA